jgi:hypothetical protein
MTPRREDPGFAQLTTFAKTGGFGGLILFVFISLFSRFADLKPLFGKMDAEHTYRLIMTFMILTFVLCVLGLVCWVYVSAQKKESHSKRVALLVLLATLLGCGSLWATRFQIQENIAKSFGDDQPSDAKAVASATFKPLDLESRKWKAKFRTNDFPPYEGEIGFNVDNSFDTVGTFLVPTMAADQHVICPAQLHGHWDYADSNHRSLNLRLYLGLYSDAGISHDTYQYCASVLKTILTKQVSVTCRLDVVNTCTSPGFEMHLY